MGILIVLVVTWIIFGVLGAWVADQKFRSTEEGFLLGVIFGPLGVLVEALLPAIQPPAPTVPKTPEQIEQDRLRRADAEAQFYERVAREREEAKAQYAANRAATVEGITTLISYVVGIWKWLDRWIIRFGWWRSLPELLRLILIGLCCATPVVLVCIWIFRGGR